MRQMNHRFKGKWKVLFWEWNHCFLSSKYYTPDTFVFLNQTHHFQNNPQCYFAPPHTSLTIHISFQMWPKGSIEITEQSQKRIKRGCARLCKGSSWKHLCSVSASFPRLLRAQMGKLQLAECLWSMQMAFSVLNLHSFISQATYAVELLPESSSGVIRAPRAWHFTLSSPTISPWRV